MKTNKKERSRSNSLSKLNEEVDQLISSEKKKSPESPSFLKKILGDEEDFNYNKVPNDIDKKILEFAEGRDFDLANSKKNKNKKKGLDLLNEQLEDLIKKTINESKTEAGGTDSVSKNSHNKIVKKKILVHKIDSEEENEESLENNNNSITSFMNSDSNNNYEKNSNLNDESSFIYGDEKELMEYLNKKRCRKKNLKKYKEEYERKKRYKNRIIILGSDEEDDENEDSKENNKKNIDLNNNNKEKKHLKRLKKNTDNKEMKLALDAECIICTCIIKELANPDGCNHDFCKSCLFEWSQRSNKCPMCKKIYNNIFIYDNGIKKQMSIYEIRSKIKKLGLNESDNNEESNEENNESSDESNIEEGCYICGKNTDQANLLVCERCGGNCCHYYCINLDKIPEGKWFCGYCMDEIREKRLNKKKVEHFFL